MNIIPLEDLKQILLPLCFKNGKINRRVETKEILDLLPSINFYTSNSKDFIKLSTKKKIEQLFFPKICPICNKEFIAIKSFLCSKKCFNTFQSNAKKLNPSGFANPNYIKNKFGVDNISQLDHIKAKKKITRNTNKKEKDYNSTLKNKQTKLERYGNANYTNIEKQHKTKLEKYGTTNLFHYISYSNISQDLFNNLTPFLNEELLNKTYFATKNKEFNLKYQNNFFLYDFVISSLKICIEFNGDKFHANPKLYNENDCPNPFNKTLTAKEIWQQDHIKKEAIEIRGYKMFIIWESEYKENPKECINRCLNFINKANDCRIRGCHI